MKQHLLLAAALLLLSQPFFAQNNAFGPFVDKYKSDPSFTFAFVSKDLLETASSQKVEDKDWKKLQQVVKNIGSLTILAADERSDAHDLYKEAYRLVPEDLDELLSVKDDHDRVRIWVKESDGLLSDLVLLAGTSDEFVLVTFAGALELDNLGELARLFDAEEAEDLARSVKAVSVDFSISPNPASGAVQLQYLDTDGDVPQSIIVSDVNGHQVATINTAQQATQTLQLGHLPVGQYWIQMKTTKGKVGVKSLLIAR